MERGRERQREREEGGDSRTQLALQLRACLPQTERHLAALALRFKPNRSVELELRHDSASIPSSVCENDTDVPAASLG